MVKIHHLDENQNDECHQSDKFYRSDENYLL